MSYSISITQDGNKLDDNIKKEFELIQGLDTRFKQKKVQYEVLDFVGMICKHDRILIVFPKHFYSEELLDDDSIENLDVSSDITLLFNVIQKYVSKRKASRYIGSKFDFNSDYPFSAFFSIYKYFQRYGIYKESIIRTKRGFGGKISWKETLRKASKVYANGNFLMFPFYFNINKSQQVFLSDCMAFALDYTLERFSFLLAMPKTNHNSTGFDFFSNSPYVIQYLHSIKNNLFKDAQKQLVQDLIEFYSILDGHHKGGDIRVKIDYFNLVWEEMVEHYLNKNFQGFGSCALNFNTSKVWRGKFSKQSFKIDNSINNYTIHPDHYCVENETQYIFDSKYYDNADHLNYKQYSYHEMLKNEGKFKTISALLVPCSGGNQTEEHFFQANEFIQLPDPQTVILLQKLNIKEVMKNYV